MMPQPKTDIQFAANIIHMLYRQLAAFFSSFTWVSAVLKAVFASDFGSIDLFGPIRTSLAVHFMIIIHYF